MLHFNLVAECRSGLRFDLTDIPWETLRKIDRKRVIFGKKQKVAPLDGRLRCVNASAADEGMKLEFWYLILGGLLVTIALTTSVLKRLPLTSTLIYLGVGMMLGPLVFNVASLNPILQSKILERASELAVIISLFTTGLKLRLTRRHGNWGIPIRLAFVSMALTVGMIALVGFYGFGLPLGGAILLGAILAPTDPVLASDVQLESATDRDKLRFSLTGEAGLNDGTAFPFVMLGLGLLGLHEIGQHGWRWMAVDLIWATVGGLTIGAVLGILIGRLVIYLRREHKEGVGREEFLTLGLIGLAYGTAVIAHTYGFLAVFAAGLGFRVIERQATEEQTSRGGTGETSGFGKPIEPAHLAASVLNFNEQMERILEVGLVLVVGMMLTPQFLNAGDIWFVPVLLLVIRPMAVFIGLAGGRIPRARLTLISWFGIRGIGSIYYLAHGIGFGLPIEVAQQLVSLTLWVIATSVVVHGISVTPLMNWYQSKRAKLRGRK